LFGSGNISDGQDYIPSSHNLNSKKLSFNFNKKGQFLDLKSSEVATLYDDGDFWSYDIQSEEFLSLFSIVGRDLNISSDRIFNKSQISYHKVTYSEGISRIFVSDMSIFNNINGQYDKVNIDGILHDIITFSAIEGTISIESDDVSGEIFLSQIVYVEGSKISIHKSSSISSKSQYTVYFIESTTPEFGTAIAVEFNSGKIYSEYLYLKDLIEIYYEYGDNEIEWTRDGLKEGESYFVSYEYGALRTALRANFGLLTDIDYFKLFSLDTDREIYRDALEGSLNAFSAGSTKDSISSAVKAISKTDPDIAEGSPKGWILGRDTLKGGNFD